MSVIHLGGLGARGQAFRGPGSYSQLGFDVASAGDVNNDGVDDFLLSAAYSANGTAPGGVYLIFGKPGGLGLLDLANLAASDGVFFQGEGNSFQSYLTGEEISSAGDINGDGYDDILIGAPRFGNYAGKTYVLFGKAGGFTNLNLGSLSATDGFTLTHNISDTWSGQSLSAAGDINDDGYGDFLVGSAKHRAYVVLGKAGGFAGMALNPFDPSNGFIVQGNGTSDTVGGAVAGLGDFNGDGIDDYAIGAYGSNVVYVLFGKAGAVANVNVGSLTAADGFVIPGGHAQDFLGYVMSRAGDVNGDGLEDMILGTNNGKAYVVFGRPGGAASIDLNNLGSGGFIIQSASISFAGAAAAGDVNGDGYDDLIVGAPLDYRDGRNAGGAFIVYGKADASGTVNADALADTDGYFLQGEDQGDDAGRRVSSAGDVNGDGFDDVLVGASRNDTSPAYAVGAAYLVFGEMPVGDVVRIGTVAGQTLAGGLGNDSLDGRGGDDRLVGNDGDDLLDGGDGSDTLRGGVGIDTIHGRDGDDRIEGGEGSDKLYGGGGDDIVDGGGGNDALHLWDGGDDSADGGAGNDNLFLIGALTAADLVDGGAGSDTLVLQGHYAGGLTLTANVTNIELISILAGSNTNFGESGSGRYDYDLTVNDANFSGGIQVRVNGSALLAGEDFTFDGSAELDSRFVVYGGRGVDTLTGSRNNDIFFLAEERFAAGDTVNGGAGYDGMFLRGNYTIDFNAPGYTGLFTNIENLTLTSATDERYARGGGTEFDYNVTLSNAIVKPGETLTVSGALLMASETMIVDASAETDGSLSLFGGKASDTLKGGALADLIHGNLGADLLTGNGGSDSFRFQALAESDSANMDQILDFAPGTDKIDLSRIDADALTAGNQAFTWIGSNAFSGAAGQLRAYQDGSSWFVEGDSNGDGVADLVIQLSLEGGIPLGGGDFLL